MLQRRRGRELAEADTANAHTRAAFITGKVNVIRLGGGFGESVIGATHLAVSFSKACPGNREQVCPSGPMPSSSRSNRGKGDREYLDIYLQEIYGTGDGYGITILIYNRNMGSPMIALVVKYGTVFSSFGIRIFESLNDSMITFSYYKMSDMVKVLGLLRPNFVPQKSDEKKRNQRVIKKPPPNPILCIVTTPLQNMVAIAASTAVPFFSSMSLKKIKVEIPLARKGGFREGVMGGHDSYDVDMECPTLKKSQELRKSEIN
ncbi:hypothetical protein HUJ04_007445 [Dendroctonus ponderosae]|nr:hypothetical protein HUJ04_007445 [Dendroctonus ponderosae]